MISDDSIRDEASTPVEDRIRIVEPRPGHEEGLACLSRNFVEEAPWAANIPIGQMTEAAEASSRLFGEHVAAARVAVTGQGEVVGYAGVYRRPHVMDLSVLVHRDQRRHGLGRELIARVFQALPSGTEVEAWVAAVNETSLRAMPAMGFVLDRTIEDQGRKVRVYTRMA